MRSHHPKLFMTGLLSNLHPQVVHHIENDYWFHRSPWMETILKDIFNFFDTALGRSYKTLALTATALGGREALLSNLVVPGGREIVLLEHVSKEGVICNLEKIVTQIRKKNPSAIILVDLTVSFGADSIPFKEINADGYLFTPEKSLGGIPGITLISLRPKIFTYIHAVRKNMSAVPFTFDLLKYEKVRDEYSTPFSPDISALVGLGASLEIISKNGGLTDHIARHAYWAKTIRAYLARYGFKPAYQQSKLSNMFTIFHCPKNCSAKKLVRDLEKKSIVIFPVLGNDHLVRIGHVGYLPFKNLNYFLKAWQQVMETHLNISFPVPKIPSDIPYSEPNELFESTSKTLLSPGPTKYHPEVFQVTKDYYHPGTQAGIKTVHEAKNVLKMWLNNSNDPLIFSTPSTGLLEASIANLTLKQDRGLVISHGKFGERFRNIARALKRQTDYLEIPDQKWGQAFSPEAIGVFLKKDSAQIKKTNAQKISFLCFQQTETSSGVSYHQPPLMKIIRVARRYNPEMIIIMDGVSGIAVHDLNFKKLDIDAIILGSQKGLGVSSGISYVQLSNRAISYMLDSAGYKKSWKQLLRDPKRYEYLQLFEEKHQVHYFSYLRKMIPIVDPNDYPMENVFTILSTVASLRLMEQQGGKEMMIKKCASMARYVRSESNKMGLRVLAKAPYQSNSVTPLLLPKNVSASDLRKKLERDYGIFIAGAQSDYWKPRMIRIGHMGHITLVDIKRCLDAIRTLLSS